MKNYKVSIIFLILTNCAFGQYIVESIPNPKDTDGGWVSNPDHIISGKDVQALNEKISAIESQTSVEIAVVVVGSIGEEVPKEFANRLFNHWGIGKKDKNNGLLLLLVMEPKRWEFETGYGLEGELPDVVLFRIGTNLMVPYFKEKKYGPGIIAAVDKISEILQEPSVAEEYKDPGFSNNFDVSYKKYLHIICFFVSSFLSVVSFLICCINYKKQSTYEESRMYRIKKIIFLLVALIVPAFLIVNYYLNWSLIDSASPLPYVILLYFQVGLYVFINRLINNIKLKSNDPHA